MRKSELRIIEELRSESLPVNKLAESIDKSQSWTSELVSDLSEQNLIKRDPRVNVEKAYTTTELADLIQTYSDDEVLVGKKEEILKCLVNDPKTVAGLKDLGFRESTVYNALKDLRDAGVVEEAEEGYTIVDEALREFLEAKLSVSVEEEHEVDSEKVIATSEDLAPSDGVATGFSAFKDYGTDYRSERENVYSGDEVDLEQVLVHAIVCARNQEEMGMCCVYYLKHRDEIDVQHVWDLANKWDCVDRWADLVSYVDHLEAKNKEMFPRWNDFENMAWEHDIYPLALYPKERIVTCFQEVDKRLREDVAVYLIGGANLTLRNLKGTTPNIDAFVDPEDYDELLRALRQMGYMEREYPGTPYEAIEADAIMEKDDYPRWVVWKDRVANSLRLTAEIEGRSTKARQYDQLRVFLTDPRDIFLFKSVMERDTDFEDAALVARHANIPWEDVFEEIKNQDDVSRKKLSFSLLNLLSEVYEVEFPIDSDLASYVLENALILKLKEPRTIKELRRELDYPENQIYKMLQKLESEDRIEVDRSGKLNTYVIR